MYRITLPLVVLASPLLLLLTSGCPGGGGGGSTPIASCGNGEINGFEMCDGEAFARGRACDAYGLANGDVQCNVNCTLNFATCSYQDYCTANDLYNDGNCDPCDALGGVRDPDCAVVCAGDGTCADTYEPLVDAYTCRRLGLVDPDCGLCGNRILDGNELCDGTAYDPNAYKCEAFGYYGGQIRCRPDCGPDFSTCLVSDCGDGQVDGFEECDGTNFGGHTCADYAGVAGTLSCTQDCKVDASACVAPGCNNGVIEAGSEDCEGENLGGATCESLGYLTGTLSCNDACHFDETQCVAPGCKNGIKEDSEDCEFDGATPNLQGATCESLGFVADVGEVQCSPDTCKFDTSSCKAPGCGNGVKETGEDCEGSEQTQCSAIGFDSGTAVCSDCKWIKNNCVGGCGNGKKEINEKCDGADLAGQSCLTQGYGEGTLSCKSDCTFNTTQCSAPVITCGNGKLEPTELCDGTKILGGITCEDFGLGSGTVSCSNKCLPDFSGCTGDPDFCWANGLNGNGLCEPCAGWGGESDIDCGCSGGDVCEGYWLPLSGYGDTCELATGARDPDCAQYCGDGNIQAFNDGNGGQIPVEPCDGNSFLPDWSSCQAFGFTSGTLKCDNTCHLDFSGCH
ncbi:MAG: hypothetical protein EP329_26360 [Deltaproteobacteria bacterium]|nr:MAG: hypothetical protein EP329_26360 [Deltaproteobacteria bacterium]